MLAFDLAKNKHPRLSVGDVSNNWIEWRSLSAVIEKIKVSYLR